MKPRIIITGIAGFIGSNLAIKLLEKGYEVVGIDNLSYGIVEQIPSEAKFYNVDIRSEKISKIIKQDDIIFHLAAKNCISDCEIDPVDTISNNILGSMNLYQHAVKNNAQKFIYSDSSAVYEGNTNFPSKEEYPDPISTYALSKYFTSKFYNIHNKNTDIKIIGLRYFNVYGPRQDYRRSVPPVMSAFIIKLLRGEQPYIYGKKVKKRDFIHVDDVNDFHEICISNKKVDNQIFNLGSGKNYSVKEIYDIIAKILSTNLLPIYKDELPGEAEITLADITAALKFGWNPKISLRMGLLGMIDYIKKNNIHAKY